MKVKRNLLFLLSKYLNMNINKQIKSVCTLLLIFQYGLTFSQEVSFEDYNPTSTLVVTKNEVIKAKFPFIDVHGHQHRMSSQDLSPVIAAMDTLNMSIMVNLSGRSGTDLIKSVKNKWKLISWNANSSILYFKY